MEFRTLGKSGQRVSAVGFGCMGLSEFRGPGAGLEGWRAIRRALARGITHFDTADLYGNGANERLIGRALRDVRPRIVLATKCGIVRDARGPRLNGRPEHVRAACEASLKRLGTDYVDLLYLHRLDPAVAIEETVGAMADLVAQGKVRYLGLSNVDAWTLTRAEAVHPIAAVQVEYSLFARQIEAELLAACRLTDVAVVAYSPLGAGLGTRPFTAADGLDPRDGRRLDPRFHAERLNESRRLFATLALHATRCECTPAQLALAWLLSRGPHIIPIPGMRSRAHVEENVHAVDLAIAPETMQALASPAHA